MSIRKIAIVINSDVSIEILNKIKDSLLEYEVDFTFVVEDISSSIEDTHDIGRETLKKAILKVREDIIFPVVNLPDVIMPTYFTPKFDMNNPSRNQLSHREHRKVLNQFKSKKRR